MDYIYIHIYTRTTSYIYIGGCPRGVLVKAMDGGIYIYIHTHSHTLTHTHTHIYIYICVCVCVCVTKPALTTVSFGILLLW